VRRFATAATSPEARCTLLHVATGASCHHDERHDLVTEVPTYEDPRRAAIETTAVSLLDEKRLEVGIDQLDEWERAAVGRRVRPSVLQVLNVRGESTAAFACAMHYVAVDADCTCGAGHVHRGSF
jgi:hypothetical protein